MPELPEVETVRRGLAPAMEGALINRVEVRRPDLRFAFPENFADRLSGRRIISVGRRAKYLLVDLDDSACLVAHLGMSGSFRIETASEHTMPGEFHHPRSKLSAHDHVVFHLTSDGGSPPVQVVYNDPRRFGFMDLLPRDEIATSRHFLRMGIEPLGNELDAAYLAACFAGRKAPLKASLMDQRLIAGLGNIYVCEALWLARLSPDRPSGTLATATGKPTAGAIRLATAIRDVLTDAIAAGGSTLRDYMHTDGELGYFQHSFRVYDREGQPCPRPTCRGTINRKVHSGRSTFYCPVCQR
jgi:formamidopyrimidine-DNA glycosylase